MEKERKVIKIGEVGDGVHILIEERDYKKVNYSFDKMLGKKSEIHYDSITRYNSARVTVLDKKEVKLVFDFPKRKFDNEFPTYLMFEILEELIARKVLPALNHPKQTLFGHVAEVVGHSISYILTPVKTIKEV